MPPLYESLHSLLVPALRRYARLEIKGLEHLPPEGQGAILTCNHSGSMWYDAACLVAGMPLPVHFIAHYWDGSF